MNLDQMMRPPRYNRSVDGPDVFQWILEAAETYRDIKRRERENVFKEAAEKSEIVDRSKVENKKWQAIHPGTKSNGRKISPRKGN